MRTSERRKGSKFDDERLVVMMVDLISGLFLFGGRFRRAFSLGSATFALPVRWGARSVCAGTETITVPGLPGQRPAAKNALRRPPTPPPAGTPDVIVAPSVQAGSGSSAYQRP